MVSNHMNSHRDTLLTLRDVVLTLLWVILFPVASECLVYIISYSFKLPSFLIIDTGINVSDLLIGVFTAQVAMVSLSIAFSSIITQLFSSDENYLGVNLRKIVFSRRVFGVPIKYALRISLYSTLLSYAFVSNQLIVATFALLSINIILISQLLLVYVHHSTMSDSIKRDIRKVIIQDAELYTVHENGFQHNADKMVSLYVSLLQSLNVLHHKMRSGIASRNHLDFESYTDFYFDILDKLCRVSSSPNKSRLILSLAKISQSVLGEMVANNMWDDLLSYSYRYFSIYLERDNKNEDQNPSILDAEMVLVLLINAIYAELEKNKVMRYESIYSRLNIIQYLEKLRLSVIAKQKINILPLVITHFLQNIKDNVMLSPDSKQQLIFDCIQNYYHLTENYLHMAYVDIDTDYTMITDVLISEWTSIFRMFSQDDGIQYVTYVFGALDSPSCIGNVIYDVFFPCLAINYILVACYENSLAEYMSDKTMNVRIHDGLREYLTPVEYVVRNKYITNLTLLKRSYKCIIELMEIWKPKSSHLTSFDYTPEKLLFLICAYLLDPNDYPDVVGWTFERPLPRCDRNQEIIEDIKISIRRESFVFDENTNRLVHFFNDIFSVEEVMSADEAIKNLDLIAKEHNRLQHL